MPSFVIIGASLTGAKAAETLRDEGFDGEIVLVGAELERPYERPPLSKGYLLGNDNREIDVHPDDWYEEHDVDLGAAWHRHDRPGAPTIELAHGDVSGYDKLLIATGASPRRLNSPAATWTGAVYLRTIADSERLWEAFRSTGRARGPVVMAGAGWIGLETAAAARSDGCAVTVVEPGPGALNRDLGPELGEVFVGLHRRHGVEFRLRTEVAQFRAGDGPARRAAPKSPRMAPS